MRLSDVIYSPIITEKSTADADALNRYHFKVNPKASKGAIANALSEMFGVEVVDMRTSIMPGKKRRILKTSRFKTTPKWKKAIVQIKEGQKIELFNRGK